MQEAKVNRPFSPKYQVAINRLLESHGLMDIDSHERRAAILCVENRTEIERWRSTLSDSERRRCCHVPQI
jgi:hypothetical protein